jgi:hypothetical protein
MCIKLGCCSLKALLLSALPCLRFPSVSLALRCPIVRCSLACLCCIVSFWLGVTSWVICALMSLMFWLHVSFTVPPGGNQVDSLPPASSRVPRTLCRSPPVKKKQVFSVKLWTMPTVPDRFFNHMVRSTFFGDFESGCNIWLRRPHYE